MESSEDTDPLRPKLLLFLSVDVVGSTAYKGRSVDGVQPWLPFFVDFYQEFPVYLGKACSSRPKPVNTPDLWKSLGDELIFVVEPKGHAQTCDYVEAFRQAINDYKFTIREKKLPLSLKATAWTAGFPVGNAEIRRVGKNRKAGIAADFIGPSIDIGFRLSKFASERKFVISIELTLLLTSRTKSALTFRLEEAQSLKGVLNDRPYPIVWIDMLSDQPGELELQADKLIGRRQHPCPPEELHAYGKQYIINHGKPLMLPFIQGDAYFASKPPTYEKDLKTLTAVARRSDKGVSGQEPRNRPAGRGSMAKLTELPEKLPSAAKTVQKRRRHKTPPRPSSG